MQRHVEKKLEEPGTQEQEKVALPVSAGADDFKQLLRL